MSTPSSGATHGYSSSHTRADVGEVLGTLAGQQHELEAPVRPAVARVHVRPRGIAPLARRGQVRSALDVVGRRSTTSQCSAKPRSSKPMPAAARTNEFAPSAPIT